MKTKSLLYVNRLNKISITSCIIMMSIIQQLFLLTLSICKNYIMHISDIFLTLFYLNKGTVPRNYALHQNLAI